MMRTPSSVMDRYSAVRKASSVYSMSAMSVSSSGSRASRMMTSNLSSSLTLVAATSLPNRSKKYLRPSSNRTVALLSSKQLGALLSISEQSDIKGRCSRAISTIIASSSIMTASWTVSCLRTSRRVAPSPPPTMATRRGEGWANMAGWTRASWYSCSDSDMDWRVPSRKRRRSGLATSDVIHRGSSTVRLCLIPSAWDGVSSTSSTSQMSILWNGDSVATICSLISRSMPEVTQKARSDVSSR
mmetsp:Transcript_18319/g.43416  ORF Transcript_18319/g.43416 Transcript_18319/m.43416 type:complete len:243 (-) Transcript_18319:214-942(-)